MEVSDQLHARASHGEESGTHWIKGLVGPRTGVRSVFWWIETLFPLSGFEPRNVHIIASRFFHSFSSCPSFLRVYFLHFPCSFCLFVKCPRTSPFLDWHACLAYSSTAKLSSQPLDLQNDMQQAFGNNLGRAHYKWTYDDISFQEARSHCAQIASHPTSLASRALHKSRLGLCFGRAHKRPTCTYSKVQESKECVTVAVHHRDDSTGSTRYEFFKFVCTQSPRIFLSFLSDSCNPKQLN